MISGASTRCRADNHPTLDFRSPDRLLVTW